MITVPAGIRMSRVGYALTDRIKGYLVSHAHLDHVAALPVYVARRRMMKMEPPTIYLPESAIEPIEKLLKGANAGVTRFERLEVGAGIEKKQDDFVAEVMAQAKGSGGR